MIVFASLYFPPSIIKNGKQSLLRNFLDKGGRIILPGTNPLLYEYDEQLKQPVGFDVPQAGIVLDIQYGPNDTRAMGGQFTCFANEKGLALGLPPHWVANLSLKRELVDVVLGKTENGDASAFIKYYNTHGRLVQLWMHPDMPVNMDALVKAAEWDIK